MLRRMTVLHALPFDFRSMPDIDYLMQEWPPEIEEMLRHNSSGLPTADFECDITTYVDIICSLVQCGRHLM